MRRIAVLVSVVALIVIGAMFGFDDDVDALNMAMWACFAGALGIGSQFLPESWRT